VNLISNLTHIGVEDDPPAIYN